ncbi:MAG: cupin domain-containing protein [Desulfobacterales bacterium]|nr:MAG: cupin domain-containing protein [Desulfobacterales bacterium]
MMSHDHPFADYINDPKVSSVMLEDDGTFPNNARLPLLVYESALQLRSANPASLIEKIFSANRWGDSWRNGVFGYHHYHSTAHEVLGVYRGAATIQLGGPRGITRTLNAGDVVVIPAGVAHKKIRSSPDFAVVGAYPREQHWDMCYGKPGERPQTDQNIARVPRPATDPVYGTDGPLPRNWPTED